MRRSAQSLSDTDRALWTKKEEDAKLEYTNLKKAYKDLAWSKFKLEPLAKPKSPKSLTPGRVYFSPQRVIPPANDDILKHLPTKRMWYGIKKRVPAPVALDEQVRQLRSATASPVNPGSSDSPGSSGSPGLKSALKKKLSVKPPSPFQPSTGQDLRAQDMGWPFGRFPHLYPSTRNDGASTSALDEIQVVT